MSYRTFLALGFALAACSLRAQDSTRSFAVRLDGVASAEGRVLVAVYDSEANWLDTARLAAYVEAAATGEEQLVEVTGLVPGRYAVAVVHDVDSSGDVSTNMLGIPTEAYGFSNGARGVLGPPSFEEAAVEVDGQTEVMVAVKGFGG